MASARLRDQVRELKIQQHPFFLPFKISDEEARRLYELQKPLSDVNIDETAFNHDKVRALVTIGMAQCVIESAFSYNVGRMGLAREFPFGGNNMFRTMEQFSKISETPVVQPPPTDRNERVKNLLQKLNGEEKQLVNDLVDENKKLRRVVDYVGMCHESFKYMTSELGRYQEATKDRERKLVFLQAPFMHTIAMSDNPEKIEAVKQYRAGMKKYFCDFEPGYINRFDITNPQTWKFFHENPGSLKNIQNIPEDILNDTKKTKKSGEGAGVPVKRPRTEKTPAPAAGAGPVPAPAAGAGPVPAAGAGPVPAPAVGVGPVPAAGAGPVPAPAAGVSSGPVRGSTKDPVPSLHTLKRRLAQKPQDSPGRRMSEPVSGDPKGRGGEPERVDSRKIYEDIDKSGSETGDDFGETESEAD